MRLSRTLRWHEAERPIVDDLCHAGINVASIWDLVNTSKTYPMALPVLIEHLEGVGYPARIMEGLARAIVVKPAAAYWSRLRASYFSSATLGWTRTRSYRGSNTDSAS